MRFLKFNTVAVNPIYRDLALALVTGFLVSLAIVTMGYMIYAQLE